MTAELSPEALAGAWQRLAALAGAITDDETRAQYLAAWRQRFDAIAPPAPPIDDEPPILPDGRLSTLTVVEGLRLKLIGNAWLRRRAIEWDRASADAGDALKKLVWGIGARVKGGLLDRDHAMGVIELMLDGEGALDVDIDAAFAAGHRRGWDAWPDLLNLRLQGLPTTDLGNAERFHARYGDAFRFTTAKGWLGWDGRRWRVLDQEKDKAPAEVRAAVYATVRAIQDEARAVAATGFASQADSIWWAEKRDEAIDADSAGLDRIIRVGSKAGLLSENLAKWGRTSESAGKLGCISGLAERWLTVPIEAFDTDPFAINVQNGTLRFTRGPKRDDGTRGAAVELTPHAREDLLTRLAPVEWDPDAQCPIYDALILWAQPEAAMRRYLHQWGGYSASGSVGAQILHFWYGKGANGKSTVIDAWADTLGDYASTIGIETFLDQGIKKRGDAASPDLAALGGVRMLRASEPDRGAKLNESLIKAATGGEPMSVRALFKGMFELRPAFKLTMSGNHRPDVPGTDEGIWRRLKLVPWDQFREIHQRDEDLPRKLRGDLSGILARLVEGLLDWMRHGFIEPDTVIAATREYRDESDPLARFLTLCTVDEPKARVQSSELHAVFVAWAKAAGEKDWTNKGLSKAMVDKGFKRSRSNGMFFEGLRLVKVVADFVTSDGKAIEQDATSWVDAPARAPPPAPFGRDDEDDDMLP